MSALYRNLYITFHSFLNYSEAFTFFTMAIPWCDRGQYAGGQHLHALHTDVEPGPDPGQPDQAEEDRYSRAGWGDS